MLLKRMMYGRAGVAGIRAQILHKSGTHPQVRSGRLPRVTTGPDR